MKSTPATFLMDDISIVDTIDGLDGGETIYVRNIGNSLSATIFPRNHAATLFADRIPYDDLVASNCSIIPSLLLEPPRLVAEKEFEKRYEEDVKRCESLNDKIVVPPRGLRILTYNVHEWTDRRGSDTARECAEAILEISADIVCLQETGAFPPEILRRVYHHVRVELSEPLSQNDLTMTVMSKTPILSTEVVYLKDDENFPGLETRIMMVVTIQRGGQEIKICSAHLSLAPGVPEKQMSKICEKLRQIKSANIPFVLCGDLNQIDVENYTSRELEFLRMNRANPPPGMYSEVKNICGIESDDPDFAKNRWTVWTSRAVDFIFPWLEKFRVDSAGIYFTTASDHLPYAMDLNLKR